MRIVGGGLKPPDKLSGLWIERDDGTGPKIIATPRATSMNWVWISGCPIQQVEVRVVSPGHPGHSASMPHGVSIGPGLRTRLAGVRFCVPTPLNIACFGIARL